MGAGLVHFLSRMTYYPVAIIQRKHLLVSRLDGPHLGDFPSARLLTKDLENVHPRVLATYNRRINRGTGGRIGPVIR